MALKPAYGKDFSNDAHWFDACSMRPTGIVLVHGASPRFRAEPFAHFALQVEERLQKGGVPVLRFDAGRPVKGIQLLTDNGIAIQDPDMFRGIDGFIELLSASNKRRRISQGKGQNTGESEEASNPPVWKADILAELRKRGIPVDSVPFNLSNDHDSKDLLTNALLQSGHLAITIFMSWSSTLTLGESAKLEPEQWRVRVRKHTWEKDGEIHLAHLSFNLGTTGSANLMLPAHMPALGLAGGTMLMPADAEENFSIISKGIGKWDIRSQPDADRTEEERLLSEPVVEKAAGAIGKLFSLATEHADAVKQWRSKIEGAVALARANLPSKEDLFAEIDRTHNSFEQPASVETLAINFFGGAGEGQ